MLHSQWLASSGLLLPLKQIFLNLYMEKERHWILYLMLVSCSPEVVCVCVCVWKAGRCRGQENDTAESSGCVLTSPPLPQSQRRTIYQTICHPAGCSVSALERNTGMQAEGKQSHLVFLQGGTCNPFHSAEHQGRAISQETRLV